MLPNINLPSKKEIGDKTIVLINSWLEKSGIQGKIIYCSWINDNIGLITYPGQKYKVKSDLALFLNIDNIIYRVFINFKNTFFKYELNARKKALLVERKNGLVSYDGDGKKAFKITSCDKNAVVIFMVNKISDDQTNSWTSRVLCCHFDNIIPTIKHQLSEFKERNKLTYKNEFKSKNIFR